MIINGRLGLSMKPWWTVALIGHSRKDFQHKTTRSCFYWEKIWKKSLIKYPIRYLFVRRTSMPNTVTSIWYIMLYSSSSTNHVKTPSGSISYKYPMLCNWKASINQEKVTFKVEIGKKNTVLDSINKSIFYKFGKDFTNNIKKTYRDVVSRPRPAYSILEHKMRIAKYLEYKTPSNITQRSPIVNEI